uniref:Dickkopf WNT signaling pathway inhibitor 3a n=1 Tax=Amphilophus citrinellus TaxID=61819 RepID=A0A3Q0RAG6_AMPCI
MEKPCIALLVLAVTAVCDSILPELVDSGVGHILEDNSAQGQAEPDRVFVEVEQLPEDPQQKPEDAFHQVRQPVETNNITTADDQHSDLENTVDHGCINDDDCGKGRYCLHDTPNSKCLPCKELDVSCTKDSECCGEQLCVWGQCRQNATKGESGSTCHYQTDCSPDLCCAFHKALLFPVCSAKPIERERCFGASNHLTELLSWDTQDKGPRKYCPCAGALHCQHLGRGSMCLKGEDSSEEDLTDTLYSEIDYIL